MAKRNSPERQTAMHVVDHVHLLMKSGHLKAGDKIPPERDFAIELGISRASLRAGIGYLAAMGVLQVRHGVGAFVAERPTEFGSASLPFLLAASGFELRQLFEARRLLEGQLAALAATRGTKQQLSELQQELHEMYASLRNPKQYLIHDVRFHQIIAQASGNVILVGLMEAITGALYQTRHTVVERSMELKSSADLHAEILAAILTGNPELACRNMELHLEQAEHAQEKEERKQAKARASKHSETLL